MHLSSVPNLLKRLFLPHCIYPYVFCLKLIDHISEDLFLDSCCMKRLYMQRGPQMAKELKDQRTRQRGPAYWLMSLIGNLLTEMQSWQQDIYISTFLPTRPPVFIPLRNQPMNWERNVWVVSGNKEARFWEALAPKCAEREITSGTPWPRGKTDGNSMISPQPLYTFLSPPQGRRGVQRSWFIHSEVKLVD